MSPALPAPTAPGRLPLLGHLHHFAKKDKRLEFMDSLRQQGKVVRIDLGPSSSYVITDHETTREVLRQSKSFVKGGKFYDALRLFVGENAMGIVPDGEVHLRHRRLVQPMFNRAYIDSQGDAMMEAVRGVAESWAEGRPREISQELDALTMAAFLAALFGADMPAEVNEEFRRLVPVMMRGTIYHMFLPQWLAALPLPPQRRYEACRRRLRELVDVVIDGHRDRLERSGAGEASGLFTTLLTARDPQTGSPLSRSYLQDEAISLLFGASESSSVTLTWALYEITRNPDIERRVRDELDAVRGGRPLRYADLPRLVYMRCVIQEALRHYGSPWVVTRSTAEPVDVDGHRIPAGADIIISPYVIQHDPELFPDPHVFDPDRWHPDRASTIPASVKSIGFGHGARKCIGEQFAWIEIPIVLASVMQRWRLERSDDREVRPLADVAVRPGALFMTPRSHAPAMR